MTTEQLMNDLMPIIRNRAAVYATPILDEDELVSEGLLVLTECINNNYTDGQSKYEIARKIDNRFKQLTNNTDYDDVVNIAQIEVQCDKSIDTNYLFSIINGALGYRNANIVLDRYGYYGDPLTLTAIGNKYNLSGERVRQIIETSKRKIRRYCIRNGIELEDFYLV